MSPTQQQTLINDGGPAFPVNISPVYNGNGCVPLYSPAPGAGGMSLRDYFAGQALAGIATAGVLNGADWMPQRAYEIADAMIAQRTMKPKTP